MPKTYSFTDVVKPTGASATAVGGGSLNASTTYYYRVMKVLSGSTAGYWAGGRSEISDQFSVTTDATNRTARITFSCPYVNNASYRIWRSTSSTAIGSTYLGHIRFYPTDNVYNSGGTVTFDDDGSTTTAGSNFAEIYDKAHGVLTLGGSTSSDKFSIVDLYNADVANGWGVITRVNENTYKVNCRLVAHSNMYWADINKTIIFTDQFFFADTSSNFSFGLLSGTNRTSKGCEIISTSNWLTSFFWGTMNAYRTIFKYVQPSYLTDAQFGLGLSACTISTGTIQDCQFDKLRGVVPLSNVTFRNCIFSNFDNLFDAGSSAIFDDVKCLSGSRVWQISGDNVNVTARGVYTEGTTYPVLVLGANATSSLTTIDSILVGNIGVNTSSTGFKLYDKFSYNLKVIDGTGTAISSANVKIYDKDNNLLSNVNTDVNGNITEQILTRRYQEVSGMSALPFVDLNPFTIIVSKSGYETYTEKVTYSSSNPVVKTIRLDATVPIRKDIDGEVYSAIVSEDGSSSLMVRL